ncbi:MAG: MFS transporter [Acidimicrobiia bacterium]|nr:MFS transporter [Acidimicrobiia bacterium]
MTVEASGGPLFAHVRAMFDFDRREWRVLAPLTLAGFFENYDNTLLAVAVPTIALGLGVSVEALGGGIAVIRLGALASYPFLRLADSWGRRKVLLLSLTLFTVLTGMTTAAWSLLVFVAFQVVARCFLQVEGALASIVIAEEVRPDRRGAALSLLGLIAGTSGAAVLVLKIVADAVGGWGWRLFYAFALVPLVIVAWLRRNFRETRAFAVAEESERVQHGFFPHVAREQRRLLLGAVVLASGFGLASTPGFVWAGNLAENQYEWSGLYIVILFSAGFFGFGGFLLGGRLSDVFGRRTITVLAMFLQAVGWMLVFSEVRWLFAPGYFMALAGLSAFQTVSYAYFAEMFPTEVRATLSSFAITLQIAVGSVGLVLVSALSGAIGPYTVMLGLAAAEMLATLGVVGLPETSGADVIGDTEAADGSGD